MNAELTCLPTPSSAALENSEDIDPQPRRWTRDEYYRMAEAGILGPDERTELIDGEIIVKMSPMKRPHAVAVEKVEEALEDAFGAGAHLATQMPVNLPDGSQPEPDVMVVPGLPDDYDEHPAAGQLFLLVEISDSTLNYDLGDKAGLYARAGIADYWVLDLKTRTLTVHRTPSPAGFGDVNLYGEGESVSPLRAPTSLVSISSLLPRLPPKRE